MKKVEGEKRSRGRKIVVLRVSSRRRASLFSVFLLASSSLQNLLSSDRAHTNRNSSAPDRLFARRPKGKSASFVANSTFFVFLGLHEEEAKKIAPLNWSTCLHSLRIRAARGSHHEWLPTHRDAAAPLLPPSSPSSPPLSPWPPRSS